MRRRTFTTLLAAAAAAATARAETRMTTESATPFTLEPLPYPEAALAPVIDAETMGLHHGKHHKTYVDKLNEAVAANATLQGQTLEQLLGKISSLPAAIRNNGGGHWNHSFFWRLMTQPDQGGAPEGALAARIQQDFGGLEDMKTAFNNAGTGQFGSGWAWLVWTGDKLAITSTPNQDNPLMDVAQVKGTPILGNDVWEHAYYLTYRNRRADYLKEWWRVVNWRAIGERYAAVAR